MKRRVISGSIVALVAMLLVMAAYRRVPPTFLRAESGWYLANAFSDETTQRQFVRNMFTTSYGGHYTPFAFTAEFAMAKLGGTVRNFWRWRQLLAVAVAGISILAFAQEIGAALQVPRTRRTAAAAAIAALILFEPLMVEFVAWPFMLMQLLWITLSCTAFTALLSFVRSPANHAALWCAVALSYASMHALGLGIATVAAAGAALLFLLFCGQMAAARRQIGFAFATLCCAALTHAAAMFFLLPSGASHYAFSAIELKTTFGFAVHFLLASVRSVTVLPADEPSAFALQYCWPLGLLLVALLPFAVLLQLWRTVAAETAHRRVVAFVFLISAIGVSAMTCLIALRQAADSQQPLSTLPYFASVARYVIPLQVLLVGPAAVALLAMARRLPRLTTFGCIAFVLAMLIAQRSYQKTAMRFLDPAMRVSHYTAWRLLVAAARECRESDLPLPNFSLAPLTREFDAADVRSFLPLLRCDLNLRPGEPLALVDLKEWNATDHSRYSAAPSVAAFEKKLELARD